MEIVSFIEIFAAQSSPGTNVSIQKVFSENEVLLKHPEAQRAISTPPPEFPNDPICGELDRNLSLHLETSSRTIGRRAGHRQRQSFCGRPACQPRLMPNAWAIIYRLPFGTDLSPLLLAVNEDPMVSMRARKLKTTLENDFIDFAEHTSAHGIPRAYVSEGLRRALWLLLFLACFCAFGYQAYLIIIRFLRNDIIVGVEIRFEEIKFPAVTVCNMNPYKNSEARKLSSIKNALEAFEMAIDKSDPQAHVTTQRRKRSMKNQRVRAAFVVCDNTTQNDFFEEEEDFYKPSPPRKIPICAAFFDNDFYWNCRPREEWTASVCEVDVPSEEPAILRSCLCNHGFCIRAVDENSSKVCISVKESNNPAFCSPLDSLGVQPCGRCDWLARQVHMSMEQKRLSRCDLLEEADENSQQCLCDSQHGSCFLLSSKRSKNRIRRSNSRVFERIKSQYEGLLPVYAFCSCSKTKECTANKAKEGNTTCLCFYNKKDESVWPCYEPKDWQERKCRRCNTFGDCVYTEDVRKAKTPCLCAQPIHMCVRVDAPEGNYTHLDERVVKVWDIVPSSTMSAVVKKKEERDKAYGYSGVKDRIALRAKAMENIIFAVDALTEEEKWRISYNMTDFIRKCSFNGRECHVNNDFEAYLDPTYGACFTYTASRLGNMTNERAGPSYGLRLEIFANVQEYLPTTEAAGVRLTVHAHDEQPFPDTLGFSAPVGFVSSFGIKLKSIIRLPHPYGDCVQEGKNDDFIYVDKAYNTEGCQRSCIQKHLAGECKCGDPRFPPFRTSKNCPVDDPYKRECLKREMIFAMRNSKAIGCVCKQPCSQDVFSVTYSASRWPAVPGDDSGCPHGMTSGQCLLFKREESAMVEVYFEQLNYESLLESEAYGWPNLLSDFGGQLGLWMGVSVITIMEILILMMDLLLSLTGMKKKNARRPGRKSFSSSHRYSFRSNEYPKDVK
ncbi:unnamed protein product [Caenorhabditis auriculariae]|uniref:Uncharacterized protein n=1 Tax=Caenorhabditis auriculariae TaxID=2777116 RepID=A0A8S1HE80_9PELO|nr:unnamed protein product [Caenorhabditis auriculariae]